MNAPLTTTLALAQYMESRTRRRCSADTIAYYEKTAKSLMRNLGPDRDLRSLKRVHIDDYLDARTADGSARAASKELAMLKAALMLAKQREMFAGDPNVLFADLGTQGYKPGERALTQSEFAALMTALGEHRRPYLLAYVYLGVRSSELARICARDVTTSGTQAMVRVRGTKTEGADRHLPVHAVLQPVLVERAESAKRPDTALFPTWLNIRRDLHVACKNARIAPVSPNDLRRTFCTWLAESGVPELTIARLMGHTNSAMVRRVYTRVGASAMADAMAMLPSSWT